MPPKEKNKKPEKILTPPADRPVRIVSYRVTDEDAGMTVREYLNRRVKLSRHQISSLKYRPDGIVVNGTMRRVSFVLSAGDELQIGLKDAGNAYLVPGAFTEPPEILYEDSDLLIVNKRPGMVCHPSPGHYADSLANQVAAYAHSRREDWTIRPIGRLDADTSGVQIFAKNSETAALLAKQREAGVMQKTYLALCEGVIGPDRGRIEIPISRDENRLGRMKPDPAGKKCVTCYEVLRRSRHRTLVKVRIEHGRTHQIRLHMAYAGAPLAGDAFYGSGTAGEHALLHAVRICLVHPFTGEKLCTEAPLPPEMAGFLQQTDEDGNKTLKKMQ